LPKHVRVPRDQLVVNASHHVFDIEIARLRCKLGVKHYLQKQVAELLAQRLRVAAVYRLQHLVGLFQQTRAKGPMVLLPVPGTPRRTPQPGHQRNQSAKEAAVSRGALSHGRKPSARYLPLRGAARFTLPAGIRAPGCGPGITAPGWAVRLSRASRPCR